VEAALLSLDRVSQAAVLSRPMPGGENQLVAYLVPASQPPAGVDELHTRLSQQLPDYMIPSSFIYLESLPMTLSGKVDLQALLRLDPGEPARRASGAKPRTSLEQALSGIWGEILNLEEVAVDEDFFVLGGHSLLAIRMIAEINDLFHLNLPLRCIFETRTIAAMAQSIGELSGKPQALEEAAQLVLKLVESEEPSISP
jgi:acyl carrier protein